MKLLIVINMESFIFLNWRAILNLWTMFIAGLLAIVLLKPKIVINFKKICDYIFVSCAIYILLIIFACYVIDNILI